MLGRLDVAYDVPCPDCKGSQRDPKKRKRLCPRCEGHGVVGRCLSCGEWPCCGTSIGARLSYRTFGLDTEGCVCSVLTCPTCV